MGGGNGSEELVTSCLSIVSYIYIYIYNYVYNVPSRLLP